MTNRKRLWYTFGPVILALVLIFLLFSLPIGGNHSSKTEQRAAVSLSPVVFKNQSNKQQAFADQNANYVPFLVQVNYDGLTASTHQSWQPGTTITPHS